VGSFTFTVQVTDGISTTTASYTINVSLSTLAFHLQHDAAAGPEDLTVSCAGYGRHAALQRHGDQRHAAARLGFEQHWNPERNTIRRGQLHVHCDGY